MSERRFLVETLGKVGSIVQLKQEELDHAHRVLRLQDGSPVTLLDGNGKVAQGTFNRTGVTLTEVSTTAPHHVSFHLELAVLKGDSMEWAIEKAVELGAETWTPVISERCVVDLGKKGADHFLDRWRKVADQALKQCERPHRLKISNPVPLVQLLKTPLNSEEVRFWCDESAGRGRDAELFSLLTGVSKSSGVRVLIGPEGGFSHRERESILQSSAKPVSLGPSILRAETAALCATAISTGYLRRAMLS